MNSILQTVQIALKDFSSVLLRDLLRAYRVNLVTIAMEIALTIENRRRMFDFSKLYSTRGYPTIEC